MDIVPLDTMEPMEDNSYLSERAIFARDKSIERRLQNPKRKESLLDKFRAVDELIGGVSRRAIWADENPHEFYALQARLEIANQAKKIDVAVQFIKPSLPPTELDGPDAIQDADFQEVT